MSRYVERKKSWWQRCCSCCSRGEDVEDYGRGPGGPGGRPSDRNTNGDYHEEGDRIPDRNTEPGRNNDDLPMPTGTLQIQSVDLLNSRNSENRKSHHTDEFECDELIVRRGQPFQICVTTQRPFNPKSDQFCIIMHLANSQPITVPFVKEFDEGGWGCQVSEDSGQKVLLWVNTSAQAAVGKYQLSVRSGAGTYNDSKLNVYILFNPWCRMDAVFMDNEAWKQEYVLNEIGRIYYGTEHQIGERSWNYGQFDKGVLQAVLYILDRGGISPASRCDPITVTRVISAMVNSMDDNGVVAGSWSGEYADGVNPVAWVGSVDILLRYHQTGTPVKYGQCWVFAAVTTTVLRCLGIPGRTITNFASAHDTDRNLTFDVYFDENMKPLEDKNSDSVWNYHCWNDCWMTRPDLPSGYSGWQAIDATPQETSNGIYCCGPSPVLAIKNGLVNIKYDTPFIFAEVNSDKVFYQRTENGKFKQVHVEERAVGHCISTKAVGSNAREDITYLYKHPEGSAEERKAVHTAAQYGNKTLADVEAADIGDVSLRVESQDGVSMGSDIQVRILLKNGSGSRRTVSLSMAIAVMYYNGVCKESFKKEDCNVLLNPGEAKTVGMTVAYSEYCTQLVDQSAMMLTVSGIVKESSQKLATQHTFRIKTPDLMIKVRGEATVGQQIEAEIIFQNPLQTTLHNGRFHVEGPGLQRPKVVQVGDIGALKTISITERFTPRRTGKRQLIASFESDEMSQVHGVTEIMVQ
ncbi:protein-glutamine gamma-glutamyltransferase K [Bufo bufo]|uniref:protein-glutamine gamma-glutamyltransferase K n=1 Tax=Bufo bufo TaxID=8384 RepID=UPI001ABDBC19|nr:protein-glutamine gamma-glutamyltransferase K [Bufo bufo]XP_040272862.1 protein-glutamine gamma-glutamyltransferase K [Bufo bufo]XP_040272863.1 protein-glutamine gamma-glutamyltransferase K [Bufo bufo]XP_040272865.1 protein-glutamine gamma-glutamyltransferase K [Bufo bufo]